MELGQTQMEYAFQMRVHLIPPNRGDHAGSTGFDESSSDGEPWQRVAATAHGRARWEDRLPERGER